MKATYQYAALEEAEVAVTITMTLKKWRKLQAEAEGCIDANLKPPQHVDELARMLANLIREHEKMAGLSWCFGPYFSNTVKSGEPT